MCIFLTLEANCGYWWIKIAGQETYETTCTKQYGLYRYLGMMFSLKSAPSSLQCQWKYSVNHQVTARVRVAVSSSLGPVKEHLGHTWTVLGLLLRPCLSLKLKKWFLFEDRIKCSSHKMPTGGVWISTKATDLIGKWQHPTSVTEHKSFSSLFNEFWRFIPRFARKARPFSSKLEMDQRFYFAGLNETETKAIERVQHLSLEPPIRSLSWPSKGYTLDTNLCHKLVWCI